MSAEIFRVTQKLDVIEKIRNLCKKGFFQPDEDIKENSILITPPFRKGFICRPGSEG